MSNNYGTAVRKDDVFEGTRRHLVLIEGGKGHANERQHHRPKRDARALAVLALVCTLTVTLLISCELMHAHRVSQVLRTCETQVVWVLPGQSMWEIAEEHSMRGVSTQELMEWMEEENGLDTPQLVPGQRLLVPIGTN